MDIPRHYEGARHYRAGDTVRCDGLAPIRIFEARDLPRPQAGELCQVAATYCSLWVEYLILDGYDMLMLDGRQFSYLPVG